MFFFFNLFYYFCFDSEVNLKLPKAVVLLVPFLVPVAKGIAVSKVIRLEEER